MTWQDIVYMQPNGEFLPSNPGPGNPMTNPPFNAAGTPFTVWNSVCFPLPPGALTANTSFQWIQEFNSGACCDHWGLDNIQILAADPAYGLFDEVGNFLPSNSFSLSPTGDTTYNFLYTNGINDSCTTSATISLNPTDAGPDIMVACDGIGTLLQSDGVAPWSTVSWSPSSGLSSVTNPSPFANPLVDTDYTLTSDCGVDVVSVFVEESFNIDIVQPDTICLNGSSFINLSTTPSSVSIASVEWNFPGTLNTPIGNQVLASPTTTTQYVATVTSDSGCVIQDSTLLVVEGFASSISVTPSDPDVCSGESVVLTAATEANPTPYTIIQGTYSPFSTAGGTPVTGLTDDNTVGPINIGFNFPFFGNLYNSFWISSNGYMTFTAPAGSFLGNLNIPNAAQPNNIIAWGWDDMNFNNGGTVNYYVGGTAPNQYFVINYLDVPHFGGAAGTEISVQVVIYANGLIEINNISVLPDAFGTMTQGIENATGTSGVSDPAINNVAITSIGENRVNDAIQKFESSKHMPNVEKRFIGHLQSNKTKKCVNAFDAIDSIHSLKLLKKVSRECEKSQKEIKVLLEINTSGEVQKKGFLAENIKEILQCLEVQNVEVVGLMTMAPFTKDKNKIRSCFSLLRNTKDKLNKSLPLKPLKELSMGMSNDYEIAIEEGATQIRLGTVLFGPRN